jgi:hypothetical protein
MTALLPGWQLLLVVWQHVQGSQVAELFYNQSAEYFVESILHCLY